MERKSLIIPIRFLCTGKIFTCIKGRLMCYTVQNITMSFWDWAQSIPMTIFNEFSCTNHWLKVDNILSEEDILMLLHNSYLYSANMQQHRQECLQHELAILHASRYRLLSELKSPRRNRGIAMTLQQHRI